MPQNKMKVSAAALIEVRQRQDQQTREARKALEFRDLCMGIEEDAGRREVPISAIGFIHKMSDMIDYGNENYQPAIEWLRINAHRVYGIRNGSYAWGSSEASARAANWMDTHPDDFAELIRADQLCAIL